MGVKNSKYTGTEGRHIPKPSSKTKTGIERQNKAKSLK